MARGRGRRPRPWRPGVARPLDTSVDEPPLPADMDETMVGARPGPLCPVTSEAVLDELREGDYPSREPALALVVDLPVLEVTPAIAEIVAGVLLHLSHSRERRDPDRSRDEPRFTHRVMSRDRCPLVVPLRLRAAGEEAHLPW